MVLKTRCPVLEEARNEAEVSVLGTREVNVTLNCRVKQGTCNLGIEWHHALGKSWEWG